MGRVVSVVLMLFCLSGCISEPLTLNVQAAANLNLSPTLEPLPVVLKLYQLTEYWEFDALNYHELLNHDKALLGDELISKKDYTLQPAEYKKIKFKAKKGAKFIGLYAMFRLPYGQWYKVALPLPKYRWIPKTYNITLTDDKLIVD